MSFFPPIDITPAQGLAFARALHTVAAADGAHPRELALIDAMFADVGGATAPIAPEELAAAIPGADLRLLFMKLAYLVAHNEGGVTDAERALLERYAGALGLTAADRFVLEEQVLDEMMSALGR
ncbi:MAG: hypothetical protein ACK4YP_01985 [Myxococcota bacterium]